MSLFFLCSFSFGHCIVCPLIYGFWFHLWYLQAVLWSVVVMCVLSSLYSIITERNRTGFNNLIAGWNMSHIMGNLYFLWPLNIIIKQSVMNYGYDLPHQLISVFWGKVLLYCEFTVWWFVHVSHCFSVGHCIVCPLIYGFWFHLWYLQAVLWSVVVMCVLSSLYSIISRNLIHCVHG
jgi:uncharacterized MnhB-related membrane protein